MVRLWCPWRCKGVDNQIIYFKILITPTINTAPENFTLFVVSDGLFDCISGDSMEEKEQAILAACKRVGPAGGHDALCRELGIDKIEKAPDDVSVMTVIRQHG